MRYQALRVMMVTMLVLAMVSTVLAAPAAQVDEAAAWLEGQQNGDGGFSDGFSPGSGVSPTAEAVVALAAAGQDAGAVRSEEGNSPLDYLDQQVRDGGVEGAGTTAKVVLAVVAVGLDSEDFGGQDLVGQLEGAYDADSGAYGGSVFDQALVMLALANAGREVPAAAGDYLLDYQTVDGSWGFTGETAANSGDTNTTALAVQALAAAGRADEADTALDYLRQIQNEDGGWPYQNPSDFGTETDANSTALVLEAIYAVGQTPADWEVDGADPLSALLALQNENGSFSYQASAPGDNVLATIQAIPAAAGAGLAEVQRTPTTAAPAGVQETESAAETGSEPGSLPAAGGVRVPAGLFITAAGLALVLMGGLLRHAHKRAV